MSDTVQLQSILEGLLFITGDEGLTVEQACSSLEADKEEVMDALKSLQQEYAQDTHGIELVQFGNVYKFLSKSIYLCGEAVCTG